MSDYCDVENCWQKQICELHEYRFRWNPPRNKEDDNRYHNDDKAVLVAHNEIDGCDVKFYVVPRRNFTWKGNRLFQTFADTPEFRNWHLFAPNIIFNVEQLFQIREEQTWVILSIFPKAIIDLMLSYTIEYKILDAIQYLKYGTNRNPEMYSWSFVKFYACISEHVDNFHLEKLYELFVKKKHLVDYALKLHDKVAFCTSSSWIECLRFTDFLFDGRIWCY